MLRPELPRAIALSPAFAQVSPSDASKIIEEGAVTATAEMLRTVAVKRHVAIELDSALGGRGMRASSRELEQVVSNLMLDGIRAMPKGGTLRVTTRSEVRPDGEWAAIVVADQGDGIRPEHLPFIFDPFFTTKRIGEGTGLGCR